MSLPRRPVTRATAADYQPYFDANSAHDLAVQAEATADAALAQAEADLAAAQAAYDAAAATLTQAKADTDAALATVQATHDTYRP